MSSDSQSDTEGQRFEWHPDYAGKSFQSLERDLTDQIERDQRAYHAALENAEKEEYGAFNTVRDLEKRWSNYDFGWCETPADQLAGKIVVFERARESRQEMMSWQEWRSINSTSIQEAPTMSEEKKDWRENLTDEQRKRIASAMSIGIILLMVLVCIALYAIVR